MLIVRLNSDKQESVMKSKKIEEEEEVNLIEGLEQALILKRMKINQEVWDIIKVIEVHKVHQNPNKMKEAYWEPKMAL